MTWAFSVCQKWKFGTVATGWHHRCGLSCRISIGWPGINVVVYQWLGYTNHWFAFTGQNGWSITPCQASNHTPNTQPATLPATHKDDESRHVSDHTFEGEEASPRGQSSLKASKMQSTVDKACIWYTVVVCCQSYYDQSRFVSFECSIHNQDFVPRPTSHFVPCTSSMLRQMPVNWRICSTWRSCRKWQGWRHGQPWAVKEAQLWHRKSAPPKRQWAWA